MEVSQTMRLKKTDIAALGRSRGLDSAWAKSKTAHELVEIEYTERRKAVLAELATADCPDTPYREAFDEAYMEGAMRSIEGKVKELQRRRQQWTSLTSLPSAESVQRELYEYIKAMNIRGARVDRGYTMLTISRGGRYPSAEVRVELERAEGWTGDGFKNPDEEKQRAGRMTYKVEVSWASSGRTLVEAVHAVAIYQEAINAAAEIDRWLADHPCGWTWGIPKPEPETPAEVAVAPEVPSEAAAQ